MALRRVHKLYLDSRAAKERSHGHADFVWTPDRPLVIEKCRGFIDSVHMPQSFGSIGSQNANTYVAEQQPDFTVLTGLNKVYLQETSGGVTTERVVQITVGLYANETALATGVQTALGGSYSVSAGTGTLQITHPSLSWKIVPRKQLQTLSSFAGASVNAYVPPSWNRWLSIRISPKHVLKIALSQESESYRTENIEKEETKQNKRSEATWKTRVAVITSIFHFFHFKVYEQPVL